MPNTPFLSTSTTPGSDLIKIYFVSLSTDRPLDILAGSAKPAITN